ncbi:MAG: VWA domain-containing protein [Ignavibacteria bacterium]
MKYMILSAILFCILGSMQYELKAQPKSVKYNYSVPANTGEVVSTFVTNPKSIYTVTVQGAFFLTSGVNAVKADGFAIESVPGTVPPELWPPASVKNQNSGISYEIYKLPLPYSDAKTYPSLQQFNTIPELNKYVKSRINPAKYLGFRFDGRVIPVISHSVNNRYQFQMQGTGNAFRMQIMDSVESLILERLRPGYSDNSGALSITIEETVVQFCEEPKPIYDKDSVLIALDISLGVFVEDSNSVSGKTNVLSESTDLAVFHKVRSTKDSTGITVDSSFFLCPEGITCAKQNDKGVALAMVLDRSGSMLDFISPVDSRIRITEAKDASTQFVDRLGDKDEAMIISFADESRVDQMWTKDKNILKNAINSLVPTGFTAMNEAVIRAIDSIRKHPNPNRAIILLSDGGNNRWPEFNAVVNKIKEDTINPLPIYSIALGLNKNDPLDLAGLNDLKELARLTRGKTFEVYSSESLDSVYKQLTREVINDRCCVLRVPVPPCNGPDDTLRTIKVFMPVNGKVELNTITYKPSCTKADTSTTSVDESNVFVYRGDDAQPVSELMPNPSNGQAILGYEVSKYGNVSIEIYAQDGSLVRSLLNAPQDQGRYKIAIDMTSEVQGYYSVIIKIDGLTIMRPMIITR